MVIASHGIAALETDPTDGSDGAVPLPVRSADEKVPAVAEQDRPARPASAAFIADRIRACHGDLRRNELRGALAKGRALCEAVLLDILEEYSVAGVHEGDLAKLHRDARRVLTSDPGVGEDGDEIAAALKALIRMVDRLGGSGEERSASSHQMAVKPHHAQLAVSAVQMICSFALASLAQRRGT